MSAPTVDTTTSIFAHALAYAEHLPGRFHPLIEGAKQPRMKAWQDGASADPARLQVLELSNQKSNIGFVPNDECVVLDIDRKGDKDGFASLAVLETRFGALPETLSATTPNSGEHRYYRVPKGSGARTCANAGGYPGLDIRAGGTGYVVAPPSQLPEGVYAWANWPDLSQAPHIVAAPAWLIALAQDRDPLKPPKTAAPTRGAADGDDPDLLEHLADALQYLDSADYDQWIACGEALKTLDDEGLSLWLEWSAGHEKFDEGESLKKWKTFTPERTGYKAIFAKAQAAGWENPGRPRSEVDRAVAEFNQKHAVVLAGSSCVILREGVSEFGGAAVEFMRKDSLLTFYENRSVAVPRSGPDGEVVMKHEPLARVWLKHPDRRTYEGVTFAPSGNAPAGSYNLWRGYTVAPMSGRVFDAAMACRRFLHHLKYNVCRGNKSHFRYLVAWMADMIQNPECKPGVAVVMHGRKGTGKSKVCDILRALLGAHAYKSARAEQIVGKFNAHLANKLLLVAEESFFAGVKVDNKALKDLITSPAISIEAKGVDSFQTRSCHRLVMNTNSEWAVEASSEERRFLVLDVGEDHMQDGEYFAAIDRQMIDGQGLSALLALLQKFDLHGIDVRKVPQTKALRAQKRLSLEPADQFIFDCLNEGEIADRVWSGETADDPLKADVFAAYENYCRARSVRPGGNSQFSKAFMEHAGVTSYQPTADRRRRYGLPPLAEARDRFARALGLGSDAFADCD